MAESKFKKFQHKLQAEGYSEKSSERIAAVEGAKKYGWHGMAVRAAKSRARHEARRAAAA